MNKTLLAILTSTSLLACSNTYHKHIETNKESLSSPRNIIMVVADGMGPAYTSAYRYYADNPDTTLIEETVFDRHLVGNVSTYPAPVSGYVTDSAAAATALASGVKTYNGAIGVDVNKNKVKSVLHRAKEKGLKTGVVVTSQVNHATPASYISHNEYRRNYNAIADSYIDNGINTDVLMGGGWKYFIREDRNLVDEYKAAGVHYIDQFEQLSQLPINKPVLGLFGDMGLSETIEDKNHNHLLTMTKAALPILENKKGYFLLIEASQVDWAGHGNDINYAMSEMQDLASTIEFLESYVKKTPDTLVVLTADHSTGGLTIAANGLYQWRPQLLREMDRSALAVAKHFVSHEVSADTLSEQLANIAITKDDVTLIKQAKINAQEKLTSYLSLPLKEQVPEKKPSITKSLYKKIKHLIDNKTNTGWTGSGHTAIDVQVFAFGKGKQLFSGTIDNTDIAKTIFNLLAE